MRPRFERPGITAIGTLQHFLSNLSAFACEMTLFIATLRPLRCCAKTFLAQAPGPRRCCLHCIAVNNRPCRTAGSARCVCTAALCAATCKHCNHHCICSFHASWPPPRAWESWLCRGLRKEWQRSEATPRRWILRALHTSRVAG